MIKPIEEILGWDMHQEIDYASGDEVTFYTPPVYVTPTDHFPKAAVDDLLTWMHINCPVYWQFGGIPYHFWVQVGHGLTPQIKEQDTLLNALTQAVRYVDEFKEDLH